MGSHNFSTQSQGKTMSEAYKNAVDDAHYQHGHDPYNGTISTTSGFKDKTNVLNGQCEGDLRKFDDVACDNTEKWESCWGAKIDENTYLFVGWAAS